MQLRFIDAPQSGTVRIAEGDRHDCSCAWCGFRGSRDLQRYAEDDGTPTVACTACFAARHASTADEELYGVAWLPEIAQPDLVHLMRVVAVLLKRHRAADKKPNPHRPTSKPHTARKRATTVAQALKARVDATVRILGDVAPGSMSEVLAGLSGETRESFVANLRLVPLAFESDEVSGWLNDDSSLNGFGDDLLRRNSWFAADLGLGKDAVDALCRQEDMGIPADAASRQPPEESAADEFLEGIGVGNVEESNE